jgi:hypothetical protein
VLSVVACNYGARMTSKVYRFAAGPGGYPRIEWVGDADLDSDTIAEGRGSEAERDEWAEADKLLASVIGQGWVGVAVIAAEAERAGISPRMLRRAKARLHIPSRRVQQGSEGYWEWGAPSLGWPLALNLLGGAGGGACAEGRLGAPCSPEPAKSSGKRPRRPRRPPDHAPPPRRPPDEGDNHGQAEEVKG